MTTKTPAYLRIKQAIVANIQSGDWAAGTAIPAEISLAEQFGVSRMTVNRALKELEAERMLERRQGSGTFVAQQKFNDAQIVVRNIAKDITEQYQHYHTEILHQTTLHADELSQPKYQWLSDIFFDGAPAATDKLYQVNIVHYGDDLPIQYEERWVNAAVVPEFINQDFTETNTSDYLIDHVPLEYGDYQIQAKQPNDEIRHILQMSAIEPALLHTRHTKSQGQSVTYVNMWHAGDRFWFASQL
ncbi:UTRA domain-containing protein [uncultured Moraxella sp.]|uniref:UTRA domain-containing protein n=1 Tax=uncultured Moraxella sp. TaxID=263769 RepID=UPI0025D22ECA|nr:UTRA domain-containing protein [uncultured Moraxella sp.]